MRFIYHNILTTILFWFLATVSVQAQFTSGRLAVLRVGTGSSALTSAGTALFIDEYTTTGSAGITLALPTTGAGRLVLSGTATSEGSITLSSDRNLITVAGYDTSAGFASVASTTSANVNRAIGTANSSASWSIATSTNSSFSANNIRGCTSDGTKYWGVGGTTGVCSGTGTGGSGLNTVVSNTLTNIRSINIFAGQLFYTTGSGSNRGVYMVGTGTPTSASNTATVYVNAGASASPYGFSFNGDTSICYIADDRASSLGGIQRWDRSGSTWTLSYTLGTGVSNIGARGLTVDWSGANPVIYGVSAEGSANRIFKITDTGGSSSATTLVTAATNTIFRGISWTPGSTNPLPVNWLSVNARQWGKVVEINWATASETNNSHFEIERSTKGNHWIVIGETKGQGSTNNITRYSFWDDTETASTHENCYRIKQVDFNGAFSYSAISCINQSGKNKLVVQASPNPFENNLIISLPDESPVKVTITNNLGHIYETSDWTYEYGQLKINNQAHLFQGMYVINITTASGQFICKVQKR